MKTRIIALVLAASMIVLGSASNAHAFGGPIERAIINAIRNARANRGSGQSRRRLRRRPVSRSATLEQQERGQVA